LSNYLDNHLGVCLTERGKAGGEGPGDTLHFAEGERETNEMEGNGKVIKLKKDGS